MTERYYRAKISPLEYRKEYEDARKTINGWVEEKTEQKIVNLLKPGMINPLTRMVLVNAIYFKGDWLSKFDKNTTQEAQFFLLSRGRCESSSHDDPSKLWSIAIFQTHRSLNCLMQDRMFPCWLSCPRKRMDRLNLRKTSPGTSARVVGLNAQARDYCLLCPVLKSTSELRLDQVLASMGMSDVLSIHERLIYPVWMGKRTISS